MLDISRAFTVDIDIPSMSTPTDASLPRRTRTLLEYVRLPAEQYNLLDSDAVSRITSDTFRVSAGVQKILWLKVEPSGEIRIAPTVDGCVQSMSRAEVRDASTGSAAMRSSNIIRALNASLNSLNLRNTIAAVTHPTSGQPQIRCQIDVQGVFTEGPFATPAGAKVGQVMLWALGAVMPWFLTQLRSDYADWAAERPRGANAASLSSVATKIFAGSKGKLPEGVSEVPIVVYL